MNSVPEFDHLLNVHTSMDAHICLTYKEARAQSKNSSLNSFKKKSFAKTLSTASLRAFCDRSKSNSTYSSGRNSVNT